MQLKYLGAIKACGANEEYGFLRLIKIQSLYK